MQMTIDGFVARPNGELDWMWIGKRDAAILQQVIELADSCDTILMGRKMTPGFVEYWENVVDNEPASLEHSLAKRMVDMRKIVFSGTQKMIRGRNLEVENGDLATRVHALKQEGGKDIMVYGGATFVRSLIARDLVDEFYFFRKPVAIGDGLSIFEEQKILELQNFITYSEGTVLTKYRPANTK